MKSVTTRRILIALALLAGAISYAQKIDVYSRPLQAERSRDYLPIHYRIVLDLDPMKKSFMGETTVILSPLREDFDACALDARTFTVTSVKQEDGGPLRFEQSPEQLIVHFPRAYAMGDKISFKVSYFADKDLTDPQTRK